ncbi:MAG: alkane 1-monooxygenase [Saprospirales bacterium]|nr:alkane 1-monooxygenase [Saprospirales bacterium]
MEWRDLKYLIAYLAPLAGFWGIAQGGWASLGAVYVGFLMIPVLEQFLPRSTSNLSGEEEGMQMKRPFFDWLLYLHIPILYGLIAYALNTQAAQNWSIWIWIATVLNLGLVIGAFGINVAHELGHRDSRYEQTLSKILLLPALYLHFFIEHNRGHHKNVATDDDPASARLGESLYAFWFRSVTGGYLNAWTLEAQRLRKLGLPALHWRNEMLQFQVLQLIYLTGVGFFFQWKGLLLVIASAIFGFLLLEVVNYIEHYGLRRKQLPSGKYEPVQPTHSWNSDHELGRIFLYELTRHSDHHYKATRKYQILRHWDQSPQLPYGYPTSILLALLPPLWFSIMDPLVEKVTRKHRID